MLVWLVQLGYDSGEAKPMGLSVASRTSAAPIQERMVPTVRASQHAVTTEQIY